MSMRVAWARWYWIVIFTTCTARTASDWLDCARFAACVCKWSSGKKTATCASSDLRRPPPLSSDIQVLDIHDNPIRNLPAEAFANIGLLNLQKINLRATKLRSLHADAFLELRILIEVDLAENDLSNLPRDIFRGNERLRLVVLTNNPLTTLIADQFPPLPHLRMLLLDGCRLRTIHRNALRNLKSLEKIDLRRNQLTFLRYSTFSLPTLKTISLSGNPWRCDCRLREFKDWFLLRKLDTEELVCVEPSTKAGNKWRSVSNESMVCAPEVRSSTLVVRAEVGMATTFGCWVHGIPKPQVTWLFDGVDVHNSSLDCDLEETQTDIEDDDADERVAGSVRWVNITLLNVTSSAAGEWSCVAKSSAGEARAIISLVLPRSQTATARTAPGIPQLLGVVFGALGILASLGFLAAVACWRLRRRTVPPSRSFTDQEKRLLDASVVVSCDRSIGDMASPCDFELTERCGDDQPRGCGFDPVHITIEGTPGAFPPPPAEFAVPVPYGNIFISVQVAGRVGEPGKYPDLLSGGATLPRRSRTCCTAPAYDNMGPRVTATGSSSTWSLPGPSAENGGVDNTETPVLTLPPPPPEFVSL
ncbi:leucine-rich repeat-containing protein 24-like [Cydia pomonella]|uniref:leucine-rich repeat-containing protein 24-like n=1 Tax=Cydia pomonella TaxID=82600 RepID=UPI002ADD7837|nr:leucine-rich repeat-containing protein 24-like [Cydia pomonella]XP_061716874.1 leucine-rich repeat-containing protein 24-like [Cydia pomonella]